MHSPVTLLYLCCPNDRNGNPRRCYVAIQDSAIFAAYDEGYAGSHCLPEHLRPLAACAIQLWVPPSQRRDILREFGKLS